jgi:hypothetical protein
MNTLNKKTFINLIFILILLFLQGCADSFKIIKPDVSSSTIAENNFKNHVQTKKSRFLNVSTSVLTEDESYQFFGLPLKMIGVQAIWVSAKNKDKFPYWLLYPAIDPDYFSPDEVAYAFDSAMSDNDNHELMQRLRQFGFKNPIHAGETQSGFIFVNIDEDYKEIDLEFLGNNKLDIFNFLFTVKGLNYENFYDISGIHSKDKILDVSEEVLKKELENLQCCTTNEDGSELGDPLNLIFIGNAEDLFPAFVRRGWHPAEKNHWDSARKTIASFLFGNHYRYSPVSPLYAFGRKQDIALQKARGTIHQRKHLRLWLTAYSFEGKSIWVGQVSRDIGIRFTTKTPILVTHKIDPDIDEARNELVQEMLFSQGLLKIGYTKGVPVSTPSNPAYNLTDDPYFNDGLRAVLLMTNQPVPFDKVQFFNWEYSLPGARHLNNSKQ